MRNLASKKLQVLCLVLLLAVIPLTLYGITRVKVSRTNTNILSLLSQNQNDSILQVNPSPIKTVFVIVMENHNWDTIRQASSASYINQSIIPNASYANQYYSPGVHPSEANYLWMEAGTNFGVKSDNPPSDNHQSSTNHLTTLLNNNGISWKSYQEGIDGTSCPLKDTGFYAPKHNPMVYFDDITNSNDSASLMCILHIRPFEEFSSDLAKNTIGQYNFITPNLCNDMHGAQGCSDDLIATGNNWLSHVVPQITSSKAYKDGGALFITWDEGEDDTSKNVTSDGPIGMIVMSPFAKGGGYANAIHYTHSSLLKTLEEIFNVTPLLGDAANPSTYDLSDLFIDVSTTSTPQKIAIASKKTMMPTRMISRTPIKKETATPTYLPTKVPLSPSASVILPNTPSWASYESASLIADSGFSFSYPKNWHVSYQTDATSSGVLHTYDFLFSLVTKNRREEHMLMQQYTPEVTMADFLKAHYPEYANDLVYQEYGTIGNETLYEVSLPQTHPLSSTFGTHGIILGKHYAYDIGFTDVTSKDTIDAIGNAIWPSFHFE